MMKTTFPILLCVLFLSSNLYSQSKEFLKGYIITTDGTTIEGLIKDEKKELMSNSILFKKNQKAEEQRFSPAELLSFFMEPSFYYEAVDLKKNGRITKQFLRKLVAGQATLYQTHDNIYLLEKESGEVLQFTKKDTVVDNKIIFDKDYFGQLKYFLRDCQDIIAVKSIKWGEKRLINLVKKYNKCVAPSSPSENFYQNRKLKVNVGIMGGIRFLNTEVSSLQGPQRKFEESHSQTQLGGVVSFSYFRKISLQTGLIYNNYKPKGSIPFTLGTVFVNYDIKTLEVPLILKYNLSNNNNGLSPYLYGGLRFGKLLDGKAQRIEENVGNILPPIDFEINYDNISGFNIGGGLSLKLNQSLDINLEAGYSRIGFVLALNEDIVSSGFEITAKVFF